MLYAPQSPKNFVLQHVDASLIVVEKPSGLLSVPGRGDDKQDCLIRRVQSEFPDALIVHRLDRDTSGLLVLARGKAMHRHLSLLFQNRLVEKRYVAIVAGKLAQNAGEINLPLTVDWPNRPRHIVDFANGKAALTRYRVRHFSEAQQDSRLELIPETGRTHQLRVHLLALGHPILGDSLYADPARLAKANRLLLHAEYLAFEHPESHTPLAFNCPAAF